jgi:hypothetical protein
MLGSIVKEIERTMQSMITKVLTKLLHLNPDSKIGNDSLLALEFTNPTVQFIFGAGSAHNMANIP